MNRLRRGGFSLFFRGAASAAVVLGSVLPATAGVPPTPNFTQWNGNTSSAWATATNWDTDVSTNVVPTPTLNAILPETVPTQSTIDLGTGATAKTLFVDGLGYTLRSGDLTLSDQLWIQQTGGSSLTLASSGTITTPNATLGADAGKSGSLNLDPSLGSVAIAVSGTGSLLIGYDGSGSGVYLNGVANSASLSAGTILLGVNAGSANNQLQATSAGTSVTAGTLQVGVGGNDNSVAIAGGGSLLVTGNSDVAIGVGANAFDNELLVSGSGSTFSALKNVVVGVSGTSNHFVVEQGATAQSGGARLGVNVGSEGNVAGVGAGSSWTMDGTVRVGDAGSGNVFVVAGTATLTGAGKNFYVGYQNTASNNVAYVATPTGKLEVKAAGADLVVSANVVSGTSGTGATGNILAVFAGGTIDATRTLVGSGGSLVGDAGTVVGNVLVGDGGVVAPGNSTVGSIGTLTITGNLDLAPSVAPFFNQHGTLAIDIDGSQIDQISVSGLLTIAGSTLHFDTANWDGLTHVFGTYGTLAGRFGTIEGLPAGAYLDYAFNGNQLALVVPEIDPASLGSVLALVAGAFGVLERRRKRA